MTLMSIAFFVLFFSEVPSWLLFLFLRSVPLDDSLNLMVVVINLQRFLVPFGQHFWYVVSVQDFLQEGNPDRLLKVV